MPEETIELVAARDSLAAPATETLESLVAAYGDLAESEAAPPKFGMGAGLTSVYMGDKLAGETAAAPGGSPIGWIDAYDHVFGFDVQLTVRRPPRSIDSLAAGDTFLLLRVSVDKYEGQDVGGELFSDMNVMGGWIDGKTVFNSLAGGKVRPYLQYGGGLSKMDAVNRGALNVWAETLALSFHFGLGVEMRPWSGLGIYMEAGAMTIKKPNLTGEVGVFDYHEAQDLLAYPLRLGVLFSF